MKTINVSFEDNEMKAIEKAKKGQSWRKFILECAAIDTRIKEAEDAGLDPAMLF